MKAKKVFIAAIFLFAACSSCFAGISFRQDFNGLGARVFSSSDTTNYQPEWTFNPSNVDFNGSLLWEFDASNIEKKTHYYAGVGLGLSSYANGFPLYISVGIDYTLCTFGIFMLELDLNIQYGTVIALIDLPMSPFYERNSVDLLLCSKNRTGVFLGIGVTNYNLPLAGINYKSELFFRDVSFYGFNIFAGLRF